MIYIQIKDLSYLMKKIYHLATCSTCIRIIKELSPSSDVIQQDIKTGKNKEMVDVLSASIILQTYLDRKK